ncbi:MAG: hypothetical protein LBD74_01445, partial [Spirochaetaceae bacterium]|nr:hypothetical protein [Spirochaetaceae bacterium]
MGKEARRAGPITISGVTAKRHSETFLLLGNGIDQVAIQSTTEQSLVSRLEDECPYDFDIIPQEGSPSWIQRLILEGRNYTIEIKTPADIVTIKTSTSHRFTLAEGVQLGFKKSPAD